jgi:hypothetical protein
VLYVDGEMTQQGLQQRLIALQASGEQVPEPGAFRLHCMDRQPLGESINLSNIKHQKALDGLLDDTKFLVLDNMSTLMNGGPENDAESWDSMQAWLLQLRRKGITVLIVHHASRGGQARGTSKREDVLDTVIQLRHPEDYSPSEGARFEVHLTKARGIVGEDAAPFEARLKVGEDGSANWTCSDVGDDDDAVNEMLALKAAGKTIRDIAEAVGKSKSAVHRALKYAKPTVQQKELSGGSPFPN